VPKHARRGDAVKEPWMRLCVLLFSCALLTLCPAAAYPATDTVCLLHTNDVHDHIRPGYNGEGGLPYVAAYVAAVRAERADVILLDAGDVTEKGDMVSYATEGVIMYEAMRRIGYTAAVPGNHDVNLDLPELDRRRDLLGTPFLCANLLREDGATRYPASRIFDVDGVKVGVIGVTRREKRPEIPGFEFSKKALAEEAARIEPEAHLIVAVVHEGVNDCVALSEAAPAVDVFVAAHKHAVLFEPKRVERTGALIVEAGCCAQYVGRLELTLDLETEEVVSFSGQAVSMQDSVIPPDAAFAAWVREREREVCPEASRPIGYASAEVGLSRVSFLIAEALRAKAGAETGFCMTDRNVRGSLPRGGLDVNALFRVCAPWTFDVVTVSVTGADLAAYLAAYISSVENPTWAGFSARYRVRRGQPAELLESTLDAARSYSVALTAEEWAKDFVPVLRQRGVAIPEPTPCAFTVIEALTAYADGLAQAGTDVSSEARQLEAAACPR